MAKVSEGELSSFGSFIYDALVFIIIIIIIISYFLLVLMHLFLLIFLFFAFLFLVKGELMGRLWQGRRKR